MNRIICVTILVLLYFTSSAQCDQKEILDTSLYKKLNQTFSGLATGNGDAIALTNYSSFEPINGAFKFNFFTPVGPVQKRKVPFLSFSAGGTLIGENTGVLFSNSKFSSGMNAGIRLHVPLCIETHFLSGNGKEILEKACIEFRKYIKDSIVAIFDNDSSFISTRYLQGKLQMDTFTKRLMIIENLKNTLSDSLKYLLKSDTIKRLSVTTQLLALHKESKQIQLDTAELKRQVIKDSVLAPSSFLRENAVSKIALMSRKDYEQKKDSLEMTLNTKGAKASWVTLIIDIERRKYYQFHKAYLFDQQVEELKNTKRSLGIEFNFVGFSGKDKSVFAGPLPNFHVGNFGVVRMQTSDMNDYSTVELSDAVKYSSGDSTHGLSSKYQVYVDSIIKYSAWKFYGNFYRTFGKDQKFAWHIFADVEFRSNDRNPVSAGAGLLFALKNKKDRSVLNFEFYGKFSDIGKALPTKERLFYNRNEIGIHVGVPLNIPTFK